MIRTGSNILPGKRVWTMEQVQLEWRYTHEPGKCSNILPRMRLFILFKYPILSHQLIFTCWFDCVTKHIQCYRTLILEIVRISSTLRGSMIPVSDQLLFYLFAELYILYVWTCAWGGLLRLCKFRSRSSSREPMSHMNILYYFLALSLSLSLSLAPFRHAISL